MFAKKKYEHEEQILGELFPFMENAVFGREAAEQVLEKLCGLLGGEVDCVVSVTVKGMEGFLFTTLPEDEARYYRNGEEKKLLTERISGKKALQIKLEAKGVLKGLWVFEVSEYISEEEISAYRNIASVVKIFLYNCFLVQECELQAQTDCFTGLPACRLFEQDIYRRLSGKEQGFLIVVKGSAELPKPYREDGVNFFLIKIAGICISIHPDGVYRIGPDMLAVLCRERKEEVFSVLQEFMQMLPEVDFFLVPLSELDAGSVYTRIQKGIDTVDKGNLISDGRGVFPRLPVFQEGT